MAQDLTLVTVSHPKGGGKGQEKGKRDKSRSQRPNQRWTPAGSSTTRAILACKLGLSAATELVPVQDGPVTQWFPPSPMNEDSWLYTLLFLKIGITLFLLGCLCEIFLVRYVLKRKKEKTDAETESAVVSDLRTIFNQHLVEHAELRANYNLAHADATS